MQVVSANRLSDGGVVYLDPNGRWVDSIAGAAFFESEDALASGLEQARAAVVANEIIEALGVPVMQGDDGVHAISLRNAIRELGPTIAFKTSPSAATRR